MFSKDVSAQSPPQPGPKTVNLEKWRRRYFLSKNINARFATSK